MGLVQVNEAAARRLRAAGVAVAYAHGSRKRGDSRADSDLDLAVLLREPERDFDLLQQETLAAGLAADLHVPDVDLALLDRASLELRARVVQQGRCVFSDDEVRRVRFEVDTQSRWFDVAPAHAAQVRGFLDRIAERGLRG